VWQQNRHQKVYGGLCLCAVGLDILKFEQTSLFYNASYFNLGGAWSFVSEGLSPPKPPCGDRTVWQNFSLLFNANESEKYSGYAGKFARYVKLSVYKHDWHNAFRWCLFCFMSQTCAGTILPSFEHNRLKWSCDK